MPINHYFSKDPDKKAKFIFNFIAKIYGKADTNLSKGFWESTKVLDEKISIKGKTVLDIGCGSGAWAANFKRMGAQKIVGVDFSDKMLFEARKNHPDITFFLANAENLHQFENASFEIVTASFVLHGVKQEKREQILKEMNRISSKHVVLHDFIGKTPLFVRFLEFLEGSDYKNFKINFCRELQKVFKETSKTPTRYGSGLYIGQK